MSSIFHGRTALRFKYNDLTYQDLTGFCDLSTAVLFVHFNAATKIALIHNCIDADVVLSVVHPEADPNITANRLVLMELPCGTGINGDMLGGTSLNVDPGTYLYVHIIEYI